MYSLKCFALLSCAPLVSRSHIINLITKLNTKNSSYTKERRKKKGKVSMWEVFNLMMRMNARLDDIEVKMNQQLTSQPKEPRVPRLDRIIKGPTICPSFERKIRSTFCLTLCFSWMHQKKGLWFTRPMCLFIVLWICATWVGVFLEV